MELQLGRAIKLHNAPSPLVVRRAAAGHTEWYRGALDQLTHETDALERCGYAVHRGLRPWLRAHLLARSDRYTTLGIEVETLVPGAFWKWHRSGAR